jgi:peptide deformylase
MTLAAEDGFVRVVARADNTWCSASRPSAQGVSELSAAFALAIEMGARLEDVAGTIHAHPTESEAFQEAALKALGRPLHPLTALPALPISNPQERSHGRSRHRQAARPHPQDRIGPVPAVTDEVRGLVKDMLDTMYAAPGIGLAAVQIGVPKAHRRDRRRQGRRAQGANVLHQPRDRLALRGDGGIRGRLPVDPGILRQGRAPGRGAGALHGPRRRGKSIDCGGLLATCIQHEIDHVNGVLFIDHLTRLKRDRIVKKFIKAAKLDKEEA